LADLPVDAALLLNSDQNRMEETRKEHEEALKTYRELAQKEPETYLPEVAQTLNNLGIVDSAQNRAEEARKAFAERYCQKLCIGDRRILVEMTG